MQQKPSKLPWKLRTHPVLGCFIEGPTKPEMGYALEIMGDDYNGYGDEEQRQADAAFIVKACNSHDKLVRALRAAYAMILEEVADGKFTEQAELCREALHAAEVQP